MLLVVFAALPASAQQSLTWDANGAAAGTGGTGTWNTTLVLWDNSGVLQAWNNASVDNAFFAGTAGTVTLGVGITAHNLSFLVGGFTVTGNTLTLGGVAPAISLTAGATTIASAVTGSAGLSVSGAGSLTLSGVNSYSGGLTINGPGTVTLSNAANTYTGPTTINGGTLLISAANRLPVGTTVAIANAAVATLNLNGFAQTVAGLSGGGASGGTVTLGAGTLTVNKAAGLDTFAGTITGTGGLAKNGAGTLALTGANTYSGTTTITAGTLQLGAGGTIGSIGAGAIANSGAFVINRSDALTLSNVISGTGSLTQAGSGTTTLTGANTYTGATTISGGALQIGNGGTTGALAATSTVVNNGTLILNRSNALTFANTISGSGGLTHAGTGVTSLTGSNSFTGVTTITAGTLSLGAGGATGDLGASSAIVNNATLQINRSNAITLSQNISGSGSLTQAGAGTTTLTGANTYSGTTTLTAGTLQIGSGGTSGSLGSGNVTVTGGTTTLQMNRSDAVTLGQVISGTGRLTQAGTGTLVLTGNNTYSGTTTIAAGTLQLGNGGTTGSIGAGAIANSGAFVVNRSDGLTLANVISGTGSLTQAGSGTTTLTGTNTYTGVTTIASGALQIGNGGTTGALAVTSAIVNNGTLILNRSNAQTIANTISGSGGLTHVGTGVTSLTASNSFTGVTTIAAGTLSLGTGGATGDLGASSALINNATLQINRSNAITLSQNISGTGALSKLGAGTATLTGNNSYAGTTTITAGTLEIGAGGTSGSLGAGNVTVTGATTTLQVNRSDTVTLGQVVSGTGRLFQVGTGTLVLTGANTYSGTTTITAGTLQLGNGGTTGSIGAGAIANSGVFAISRSDALTLSNVISGTGGLTQAGSGTTTLTGTNTYTGATTIAAGALQIGNGGTAGALAAASAVVNNGTLILNRSNAQTIANAISGSGGLTQAGAGTTSLTASNSFTGVTTIAAGTLSLGTGGTTGDLGSTSAVVNNATLQINRSNAIALSQNISGTGALTKLGAGTATLTGNNSYSGATAISAGTLEVGAGGTNGSLGTGNVTVTGGTTTLQMNRSDTVTLGQVISGTGRLTQAGSGTLILTGANTYSGTTTITAGTLQLGNGGTTGAIGAGAIANSGAFVINRSDAFTLSNVVSGVGALTQAGAGTTTLTGTNTYTGATTIAAGALQIGNGGTTGALATASAIVNDGTLILNRSNTLTFANAISGSGGLTKLGAGTTSLTGSNSFTGVTTIGAGTLSLGSGGTTGDLGASSAVINNATLQINRSNAITLAQNISGSGALTKLGAGTATLTGASTYTGPTTLTAGTLIVNGSLASALTAGSGTTLGGSGSIAGAVTIGSGATLAPGNSPGTLTVGSLNLASNSILNYELSTPGVVGSGVNDLVVVTGDLVLDGILNVATLPGFGFGSYRLFNYGGTFTDNVLQFGTLPIGYLYQIQSGTPGQIDLLVGAPALQVWSGGSGTWAAGLANWTDVNGNGLIPWGGYGAVFDGAGGTVTVEGPLDVHSMEFRSSYLLNPGIAGSLDFGAAAATIAAGNGVTAMVNVPLRGSDGVVIGGPGAVVLNAENVYTGDTIVDGGTLVVSSDANLGAPSGQLRLANGGTLQVTASLASARDVSLGDGVGTLVVPDQASLVLTGRIDGPGALIKTGDGSLTLTGLNTYAGGTLVAAGTLRGDAGSLQGDVIDDAAVVFDQHADGVFRGTLSGAGSLEKVGTGELVLESGHWLQGPTIVSGGTLAAGGSLGGSLRVNPNATLRPLGVLGVQGNVTFASGSQLTLAIAPDGSNSALVTDGTAVLGGASIAVDPQPGSFGRVSHYALIHANSGITGVAHVVPAGSLEPFLSQNGTTLFATVLNMDLPLQPYAQTQGGAAAAGAIDRIKAAASGDLARGILELTALDDSQLGAALDMVAGEIHASTPMLIALDGEGVTDAVREEIADRPAERASSEQTASGQMSRQTSGWLPDRRTPHVWLRLRGERAAFESSSARTARTDLEGFVVGADWMRSPHWVAGVGGSYTRSRLGLDSMDVSSRIATPRALVYLGYSGIRFGVDAGAGVARPSLDVQRRLAFVAFAPTAQPLFGGVDSVATTRQSALAGDLWGQGRFSSAMGLWRTIAIAGVRTERLRMNGWREEGADGLSLSAAAQTRSSTQTDARLRISRRVGRTAPWFSASYRRELSAAAVTTLRIGDTPEGEFSLFGQPPPRATAIGVAGVTLSGSRAQMSMSYQVRRADTQVRHIVQLAFGFE